MIQFITHFTDSITYEESARLALEGGCRWVQLRMKGATESQLLETGERVGEMCRRYGARFIIDDHVELVERLNADGVHLGKNDMPIDEARRVLGDKYIIGGTANTFEDIMLHVSRGADYIGCGPFRFTTTKEKLSPVLGLDGYRQIAEQMKAAGVDIPVVAIGGITASDIAPIMQTGITGIAISGTVLRAEDPVAEMRRLIEITNK